MKELEMRNEGQGTGERSNEGIFKMSNSTIHLYNKCMGICIEWSGNFIMIVYSISKHDKLVNKSSEYKSNFPHVLKCCIVN